MRLYEELLTGDPASNVRCGLTSTVLIAGRLYFVFFCIFVYIYAFWVQNYKKKEKYE